ncbi:putative lipoprotein, partial [Clostridium botulinum CFSAN001627]
KETNEFSYKIISDTVRIKSNCGNLKIKKGNVDEVKVTIEKLVGGKSEDELQEALNSISCTLEDGTINISLSSKDKSKISSVNIEATIVIPKKINSLNIENNIGNIELEGNYKDLKVQMENGNISYKGELEKSNISSKVGNINLNLQQLESNYQYEINGEVVNVNIKVPNKSKI